MPYAQWLPRLVPHWLQRQWAGGVIETVAEELDDIVDTATRVRKSFLVGESLGTAMAEEALARAGSERQLERGPSESAASYAARLQTAWDTWLRAGSHLALLQQIRIAGFDTASLQIIQRSGRRTAIDGSGNLVVVDGPIWTWSTSEGPEAYAEFGLIYTAPQAGLTWSPSTGLSPAASKLHRIVHRWRPAKARFMGTRIFESGAFWGWPPDRTWGSFNYGGSLVYLPPE